jgi:hypothetical protein
VDAWDRRTVMLVTQGNDLRVRPESAAGQVDGFQVGLQQFARRGEPVGLGDDHLDAGAEGVPDGRRLPGGRPGGARSHHEPPGVTWAAPEADEGAAADAAPAEPAAVAATPEPPDVACIVAGVSAAEMPAAEVLAAGWAAPLGRVAATAPAATRPAAPAASAAARIRAWFFAFTGTVLLGCSRRKSGRAASGRPWNRL